MSTAKWGIAPETGCGGASAGSSCSPEEWATGVLGSDPFSRSSSSDPEEQGDCDRLSVSMVWQWPLLLSGILPTTPRVSGD